MVPLLSLALACLVMSGFGVVVLCMSRGRRASIAELLSLSVLFGSAFVSLALFLLGFFFHFPLLKWLITAGCILLGSFGILVGWRRGLFQFQPSIGFRANIGTYLFLSVPVAFMFWLAFHQGLGWDGLFIWEIKARLASLNGGAIPSTYYGDPSRVWSHPEYPLLLPLTEAWVYGWIGIQHQGLVKILFPLYYMAALGLLYTGCSRLRGDRLFGYLAVGLLIFIPGIAFGDGASTGYADAPLGVFYLACVIYLIEYIETGTRSSLHLVGSLGAILPWIKQDGFILWLSLAAVALPHIVRRREGRSLLPLCLPALIVMVGWRLFLNYHGVRVGTDFVPLTIANLWANLGRVADLGIWMGREWLNWRVWGGLWPVLGAALLLPGSGRSPQQRVTLALIVLLPIVLYASAFVFSSWNPFLTHVRFSMPRLMLQTSFAAVLALTLAVPRKVFAPFNPSPMPSSRKPLS